VKGQSPVRITFQLLALVSAVLLVVLSCAAVQTREQDADTNALVRVVGSCPFTIVDDPSVSEVELTQPVIPRVWYPGDGPVSDDSITYYAVRCWPGCHDPNSAPRPQHY
jgi:hypothetical protein